MDTLTQVEDMGREYLGTATYSPDDNKLRFYPRARLSADDYARIKAAGFSWAPKQELFVAGMWMPGREDLLTEWCGEVGDEDTSLVDRAEERAERFDEYSEKRAADADRAHATVASIVEHIPLGQPRERDQQLLRVPRNGIGRRAARRRNHLGFSACRGAAEENAVTIAARNQPGRRHLVGLAHVRLAR